MKKPVRKFSHYRQEQGYDGEVLVTSLLPHARHLNHEKESWMKHDIIWKGLKIDAKTCKRSGNCPSWSPPYVARTLKDDIIFVHVFIRDNDRPYFWVRHSGEKFLLYANIRNGITGAELPEAIYNCHKLNSQSYKKTVDRQLSML